MNQQEDIPKQRPTMLTILCILTFIGSGVSTLSFFMVSVMYELFMQQLAVLYANMPEANFLLEAPRGFFMVSFILSAASVAGAIFMWNLRKIGFHIYTSAQLVYLVVPLLYFGGETNPLLNIIVTALFVYLYARNLQYMR
ncbi:MAG: hypothetical protein V2I47_03380 [Bacteroidales bacterium]|jgi:hypothetical protein|nr:hypothetical protein [Bacteroidales bacterium]